MSEDAVLQVGERMLSVTTPKSHQLRRDALLHSFQGPLMQVALDDAAGRCCALGLQRTSSTMLALRFVHHRTAVLMMAFQGLARRTNVRIALRLIHKPVAIKQAGVAMVH